MENQHRQIRGYRELNAEEIALINTVKSVGEDLGLLVQQIRNTPEVDQRWVSIAATDLQTGIMALTRAIARPMFFAFALLVLVGCSGFKEVAKTIEGEQPITFERTSNGKVVKAIIPEEHHIVLTQGVINGYTVDQARAQTLQHCTDRYTSEEMAAIRAASPSKDHSWYKGCTHLTPVMLTKDSSKAEKLAGIAMAGAVAYGLHQVGRGIAKSGDHVTQEGGNAENTTNSGNKTVKGDTNINSGNKNIMK